MIFKKTCIICPNGCDLEINVDEQQNIDVKGASCPRGEEYARREVLHPVRTIATSIRVKNGSKPLVSVRLDKPVPKEHIMEIMDIIKHTVVSAPVHSGDVLLHNIMGLDSNVIATSENKAQI